MLKAMKGDLSVGDFLPAIGLPSAPGGQTTLIVTVHSALCEGCREYLAGLAALSEELRTWDARLIVIAPGSRAEAARLRTPVGQVLGDEGGRIANPQSASVFVADRYGQIFDAARAGASHRLPAVRDLEEWLKYLGTLCPE